MQNITYKIMYMILYIAIGVILKCQNSYHIPVKNYIYICIYIYIACFVEQLQTIHMCHFVFNYYHISLSF